MHEVKIGTRVMFKKTGIRGTIIGFVLDACHPFHVRWDKGADDWYGADDLALLPPEKVVDPVDEHLDMLRGFIDGQDGNVALMFQPLVDFLINLKSVQSKIKSIRTSDGEGPELYPPHLWEIIKKNIKRDH